MDFAYRPIAAALTSVAKESKNRPDNTQALIQSAIAQAQAQQAQGGFVGAKDDPQLWDGGQLPKGTDAALRAAAPFAPGSAGLDGKRSSTSLSAALNQPYNWLNKPSQLQKFFTAVSDASGKPVTDFFEALGVWQKAVQAASESWAGTEGGKKGTPLTPWTALDLMKRSGGGVSQTATHKTISEVTPGTAWGAIQGAARQLLGRAATSEELAEFAHKADQIASNNPLIETTTVDGSGNKVTKSSGGFNNDDLNLAAANAANSDPEAGAFQAAGPLYNAFLGAISNPFELDGPQ